MSSDDNRDDSRRTASDDVAVPLGEKNSGALTSAQSETIVPSANRVDNVQPNMETNAPKPIDASATASSATASSAAQRMARKSFLKVWWPVLAAGVMVAITAFWLLAGRWGLGRDDWFITPRRVWWSLSVWLLPVAVLALFGGLATVSAYDRFRRAKSRREQKTSVRLCVFALMMFALCWPWAALGPTPGGASGASNLIAATWSDVANGYFSQAYRIDDARRFSRDYSQQQTDYAQTQAHVATHPPGATLFYFAARRAFETSPWLQKTFTRVHRNMTGASVAESAAFARNMVAVGTGTRPQFPDSAAPCALWCAFLLSLSVALSVPAAYLLGAGKPQDDPLDTNAALSSLHHTQSSAENRRANSPAKSFPNRPIAKPRDVKRTEHNVTTNVASANVASANVATVNDANANIANTKDAAASGASTKHSANACDSAEARGLAAAALFALAPSLGLFAFTLDALIGCLAAWTLVFVARRLSGGAIWHMAAAGALLALNSFFSFGALATGATIVLALGLWFGMRARTLRAAGNGFKGRLADENTVEAARDEAADGVESVRQLARRLVVDGALCAAAFLGVWLVLCVSLPMQPLAIYARAMQAHHLATGNRDRWGWAAINGGMFALFCGWPVALACLFNAFPFPRPQSHTYSFAPTAFATSENDRRDFAVANSSSGEAARVVGIAMLSTLLLLTLSGDVRGEVERLWMFALVPLCALAAGIGTSKSARRNESAAAESQTPGTSRAAQEYKVLIALILLQVLQNVVMTGALAPLVRPF